MAGCATSKPSGRRRDSRGPTLPAALSRSRSRSLPIGAAIAPMPGGWRRRGFRAPTRSASCRRTGRAGRRSNRRHRWRRAAAFDRPGRLFIHLAEPTHCPYRFTIDPQNPRLREDQMDKIGKLNHRLKRRPSGQPSVVRPSRAEAEGAVRTLIRWAGDDPDREGLIGTPARVARAYEEWFSGYFEDPREYLKRTFEEVAGYD